MDKGTLREIRFITQRDLSLALIAATAVFRNRHNTCDIGKGYDYHDIADECTIAASNMLIEEQQT